MTTIDNVCKFMDGLAPTRLAEDWDNVGLLVGDPTLPVTQIMTCLTITPESAAEAIEGNANVIVTHHPLPFRSLKRLTTNATPSRLLWDLIRAGISIYSPHTGFDSATEGINQSLSKKLGITDIRPLVPIVDEPQGLGAGRFGKLSSSCSLKDFVVRIKQDFLLSGLQFVGDLNNSVQQIAVACGSGGSFLDHAKKAQCDTFVTGEATFHTCLEAKANGISLVLLGHYASERFAIDTLAGRLKREFPDIDVWPSRKESDPVQWF